MDIYLLPPGNSEKQQKYASSSADLKTTNSFEKFESTDYRGRPGCTLKLKIVAQ